MRVPGQKGLKQGWNWLRSRFVQRAIILGYHRIADVPADPYGMVVTPDRFRQQLEVLRRIAQPITFEELVKSVKEASLPERAVVLTFDDGYYDNLDIAKPLLEEFEIPAIVFVATGFMGREFWWDRLARLILQSPRLPDITPLLSGRAGAQLPQRQNQVDGEGSDGAAYRQEVLSYAYTRLLGLPWPQQEEVFQLLEAGVEEPPPPEDGDRALTTADVITLSECSLVAIGAHTVTHPVLAGLSREEQRTEILQSKLCLEQLLGQQVTGFSYPNGSATETTRELVAAVGYAAACTSQNGVVWSGSDRYFLPRFWVQSWDGQSFGRWLETWL
jgi:peptidoglycan/xylan/chitin deacetylase (PgdA/CDA1 family)